LLSDAGGAFFHVNLCTYRDLTTLGETVLAFVEMAVAQANQAGVRTLQVSLERPGARRPRTGRRFTPKAHDDVRQAIVSGAFTNLFVFSDDNTFSLTIRGADAYSSMAARIKNELALARIREAQVARPSPRFLNFALNPPTADPLEILAVSRDVFGKIDGACGFVTLDPFQLISGDQTGYEQARLRHWSQAPDMFQSHVRGVFWGNLLGPRHVATLGGYARVAAEAPCRSVEAIDGGGAYLQLTDRISEVRSAQLDALAVYLQPLLG